jgi:hypothetical protein
MATAPDFGMSPYDPQPPLPPEHAGPWAGPVPADPEPGGVPLRPLNLGEIVVGAITTIRRNPRTTLGFTAVVMVLCSAPAAVLDELIVRSLKANNAVSLSGQAFIIRILLLVFTTPILLFTGDAILTGMLTAVVSQSVLGRRLSVAEAWRVARPRTLRLAGARLLSLLVAIAVVIGAAVFFVTVGVGLGPVRPLVFPAAVLTIVVLVTFFTARFSVAAPAVGLEQKKPTESLSRSWRLVRSCTWRVAGFVLLIYLMAGLVTVTVEIPFDMFTRAADPGLFGGLFALRSGVGDPTAIGTGVAALGGIIVGTLTWPFLATARVLLYLDLRMRKEGLHFALQATLTPPDPPRW